MGGAPRSPWNTEVAIRSAQNPLHAMIRPSSLPVSTLVKTSTKEGGDNAQDGCCIYNRSFWSAFTANTLVAITLGLTYRYADFVAYLGGTELHLGWIVGVGMVGSVATRLWLGAGIDRHGPRIMWLASLALLTISSLAHLAIAKHDGVAIYLVRIAFSTALAGVWSASTTFVSARVAVPRMAEVIGMLGTSGFLGIMLGTQLGDWLCAGVNGNRGPIDRMFIAAGLFAAAAAPFAWLATQGYVRPADHARGPLLPVVRRHQTGMALVLGLVAGAAISLPATFLRAYAAEVHIVRIGLFFAVCAMVALISRVTARRLPQRLGLPRMIVFGFAAMAAAQLTFIPVSKEWHLIVPGLLAGLAQAILYPTIVTASSSPFPSRYRGLATTLILAAFDLGQVVGAPAAGAVLHYSQALGLPSYPSMFVAMAAALVLTGAWYAVWCARPRS
jgi:MFS family permease